MSPCAVLFQMGHMKTGCWQDIVVLSLRLVAPCSLLYVAYRAINEIVECEMRSTKAWNNLRVLRLPLTLEIMAFIEVIFWVYCQIQARRLNRRRYPAESTVEEIEQVVKRFLTDTRDMQSLISGWFMDITYSSLRLEDLETYAAWMLFSKYPDEVTGPAEKHWVEELVAGIEAAAGCRLPPRAQDDPKHPIMRHSLDALRWKHRPLIVYVLQLLLNAVTFYHLFKLGFRKYQTQHVKYWRKAGEQKQMIPLVFVGGVGFGLAMYLSLIRLLSETIPSDILLIELPHASHQLCEHVPSSAQGVQGMMAMLHKHGHLSAVFAAHSLGTTYVSWMCRRAPEKVAAALFVEPVVFMLFLKTVTRTFLYGNRGGLAAYLIRCELYINHALRRHFWWQENILWLEDCSQCPMHVILCENDEVVPATDVIAYVRRHSQTHQCTIGTMDTLYHGAWAMSSDRRREIAGHIFAIWRANALPSVSLEGEYEQKQLNSQEKQRAEALVPSGA